MWAWSTAASRPAQHLVVSVQPGPALHCPVLPYTLSPLPAPRYGYNYVNACSIKLEMLLADVAAAFTGAGDTVVHELFLQVGGGLGE